MTKILDGVAVAAEIRAEVAAGVSTWVAQGHRAPCLAAVLVGDDPASQVYVGSKTKGCAEAGMESRTVRLPAATAEAELAQVIDQLNDDDTVDGILVQLPLPKGLGERAILERVNPAKDVDGFHSSSVGHLWLGEDGLFPATPSGVMELFRRAGIPLAGREAVVVGRSTIVGKPMAALLLAAHATVTICHSRTKDLAAVCRRAEILVAAIGRAAMIGPDYVQEGAVVIDVGMNRVTDRTTVERLFPGDSKRLSALEKRGGTLVGDVDYTHVAPLTSAITPVPGGVGPLTVAMVISNTFKAARLRRGA